MKEEQNHALQEGRSHWVRVAVWCGGLSVVGLMFIYSPLLMVLPFLALTGVIAGIVEIVMTCRRPTPRRVPWQALVSIFFFGILFYFCGWFYAAVMSHAQQAHQLNNLQQMSIFLNDYADIHQAKLPATLGDFEVSVKTLVSKDYYFYYLHNRRAFQLNGHLAGKSVKGLMEPERTVVIALGKSEKPGVFLSADVLALPAMALFADGHWEQIEAGAMGTAGWRVVPRWETEDRPADRFPRLFGP